MRKKEIVFFTPSLNQTGSEIALLNLILHTGSDFEMTIVSRTRGILSKKIPSHIPHIVEKMYLNYGTSDDTLITRIIKKIYLLLRNREKFFRRIRSMNPGAIWYVNTIMFPDVLEFAWKNNIPVILHIHELEHMFNHLSGDSLQNLFLFPKLVIACSETCAEVVKNYGRKNNVSVCYPAINFNNIKTDKESSLKIRQKSGIDPVNFLWVMAGTMDTNKNPSVFVDIAQRLLKQSNNVSFMWITAINENNGYITFCKNKAVEFGIADRIIWVTATEERYYEYLNSANGFILTSIKESFSIVTAEALYLEKPVVSFDCGGVREIVDHETGIIVNDHDINSIVQAMSKIMDNQFSFNPSRAKEIALNFDVSCQAQKWKEIIKKFFFEFSQLSV